jgi:hypothetical protein
MFSVASNSPGVEVVTVRPEVLFSLNSCNAENGALLLQSDIKLKAQISKVTY